MRYAIIFKKHYDFICLFIALVLLLIAISQPSVNMKQQQQNYLFIVDITQSMNVPDMMWQGESLSRLDYAKQLLKDTVKTLPCGSKVGLGVFFKTTPALLYTPIETCSNYDIFIDTIDHLDWRMASQGSSNIRVGISSIDSLLTISQDDIAQVIFLTDGQEAQPLNIFTKTKIAKLNHQHAWLIVGVGGNNPTPIPKLNDKNAVIGYWSTDAIKLSPASNVDEGSNGGRDNSIATETYEYYLSQLDENYLKELSADIGAHYLRAGTHEALIEAINKQPSTLRLTTNIKLDWVFALAALLVFIGSYIPTLLLNIGKLNL